MWVSIVATAVILHVLFAALGITPESGRAVEAVTRFAVDYTFWLNLAMVALAAVMIWLHREHMRAMAGGHGHAHGDGGLGFKRSVVYVMIAVIVIGLGLAFAAGG